MSTEALRNIEIKAQLLNKAEFDEKVKIAYDLTGAEAEEIKQHDVFFNVTTGRLKLRHLKVS